VRLFGPPALTPPTLRRSLEIALDESARQHLLSRPLELRDLLVEHTP
jgi:hypothetical protein